ncbi:MAG: DUF190 domain-containing protein, partial [Actinomycetota bacterium]|nr:DUF190 domain-containing protein [Actinomycetota bacterium]
MSAPQEQGEILTLGTYFAERERRNGRFLAEEMLDLFGERGVATSIMLRGIASFGPAHVERSTQSLTLSEDPPVTITAVDTPGRILPLADEVAAMTGRGVITLERGRLVPALGAGHHGDTVRLSLYLGRRQRVAGAPAYVAVCDVLHRLGFSSAETFLGVDGTVSGQRRKARFLSRNTDVPVMVVGVGGADQAGAAIDELRGLLTEPLFTVERIVLCKSDGKTLADPRDVTGAYVK